MLKEDIRNPSKLSEDIAKNLLLSDSELCDLHRFRCDEKWAKDLRTSRAIWKLKDWERGEEELEILARECERFVNAHCRKLEIVRLTLDSISRDSAVMKEVAEVGLKSVRTLQLLHSESMDKMVENLNKRGGNENPHFKGLEGIGPILWC